MLRHHPPTPEADPGTAAAWEREIARRVAKLESGKARFVTWERIRSKLVSTKKRCKA